MSTSHSSSTETLSGSHQFNIEGYSLIKEMDIGKYVSSSTFKAVGYDWIIRYYPKGNCAKKNGAYMAVYLELQSEITTKLENVGIEFALLDRNQSTYKNSTLRRTVCTFDNRGKSWGFPEFMARKLDWWSYLRTGDCLTILCTVSIIKSPRMHCSIAVPPSDFRQQFGSLLESEEGSDVTFEVNGETFKAHKCVLAARSPVFKAQFFGCMKEKRRKIKIIEMEAPVFEAMLHFIYTDSLPEFDQFIGDSFEGDHCVMAQHLLVAADRYGLERLKIICAEMLCKNIDELNVATVLVLAEQHDCSQLKDACLEFIGTSKNLRGIVMGDGFEHLVRACPSIFKDLREKFGNVI